MIETAFKPLAFQLISHRSIVCSNQGKGPLFITKTKRGRGVKELRPKERK
jgi:hypothetical protein